MSSQSIVKKMSIWGGYLNKRKIPDRLEKFDKYKKQKRVAIASVIGLFLFAGGIKLFNTFAFYEEKKTFNVIRGRVPDFRRGDMQFAFLVDNAESMSIPAKGGDKLYDGYECNKPGVSIEWNNDRWVPTIVGLSEKGTSCTLKFKTSTNITIVNIGEYISYTPSSANYTINTGLTGYTSNQTIKPNELKLWRVIRKNSNGTVDVVSEYVSSTYVYFKGQIGYQNLTDSLNTIAKSYETSGKTVGSRNFGYDGQATWVYVGNTGSPPWPDGTSSTNSPIGSTRERNGGGDYGFQTDLTLVKNAVGTAGACQPQERCVEPGYYRNYWAASRYYTRVSDTYFYYSGVQCRVNGCDGSSISLLRYNNGWADNAQSACIRPIVTLSATLRVTKSTVEGKEVWLLS